MTRAEIARAIRELAELMERFHTSDPELERLCDRTEARLAQLRRRIGSDTPNDSPSIRSAA